MLVALKIQHTVHHMLQHFRTCNRTLFIDMADDKNRDTLAFRQLHKCQGTLLYLPYSTRYPVTFFIVKCLDGVNNQNVRLFLFYTAENIAKLCFGQYQQIFRIHMQPIGAHFQLTSRLFAGDIKNLPRLP